MTGRLIMAATLTICLVPAAAAYAQIPGLDAGTVTANIDGVPFTGKVSIAVVDEEGTLVLTHLGNTVQIQIPNAGIGTFAIELDEDGGLVGVIVGLKVGERYISPISGSITIESLSGTAASGTFAFEGKNLADDSPVSVTDGRFQVRLTGS